MLTTRQKNMLLIKTKINLDIKNNKFDTFYINLIKNLLIFYQKILKQVKLLLNLNNYEKKKHFARLLNFIYKISNLRKKNIFHKNLKSFSYVLHVTLLNSNIIINITDLKGKLITSCSSGIMQFTGSQKTKYLALINILKKINHEIKYLKNKNFAIHFKGLKKNRRIILKKLDKKINIQVIKFFNLSPHNGCRPKKIRKKR